MSLFHFHFEKIFTGIEILGWLFSFQYFKDLIPLFSGSHNFWWEVIGKSYYSISFSLLFLLFFTKFPSMDGTPISYFPGERGESLDYHPGPGVLSENSSDLNVSS